MQRAIYMDYHSTTPVDARVLERMLPYFSERFGNASSRSHTFGWQAEEAVEAARKHVAALVGGTAREIVFTSGATESNALALLGAAEAYVGKGRHIVTQATEHKAVLDVCDALAGRGWEITCLPVDAQGRLDPAAVAAALRDDTVLVSVMDANNEIGTLQPVAELGRICRHAGVLFHVDAAQSAAYLPLDVEGRCIDLLSLSAHKMYGPKGVGALYVRRRQPRVQLAAQMFGGGQERGLRPGTLNVPGIVGLGEAARLAHEEGGQRCREVAALRDALWLGLEQEIEDIVRHGDPERGHPGNLSVAFPGVDGEALLLNLRQVAVSAGSACTSATLEPSHVLQACGVSPELAHASLRFGLGVGNTASEVDAVIAHVTAEVVKLRQTQPRRRGRR